MAVEAVVKTPYQTSAGQHIALLTKGEEVYVHPHNAEALALLHPHLHALFYHYIDLATDTLTGYAVAPHAALPSTLASLRATQVWRMAFPANEHIAGIAASHPFHTVQSAVRLVGGGDGGGCCTNT